MSDLEWRASEVTSLFTRLFRCDRRRFGSRPRGVMGVSDNVKGVQWNAGCCQHETHAWLGVNLEGMKYDDWPVSRLIERELSDALLLGEYRTRVPRPQLVRVIWTRDAWQVTGRPPIAESRIAPTPISLDRLDPDGWLEALEVARECLNPERKHRGRRRVEVTLLPSGRKVEREVTPHLAFKTSLPKTTLDAMRRAKDNLEALHAFARRQARPWDLE